METVISSDLTTADGIALDWVAQNLYWTDTGRNVIEVVHLNNSARLTLLEKDMDEPRAIAVYPTMGWVPYLCT